MTRISLHEVGLAATEVPSNRTTVSNDVEETVWWNDDIVDIAFKTVDKLFKRGEHALVTLIYGADATEEQAQELENRLSEKYGSDMEISIVDGGQPIYYFLLSVE